MSDEDALTSRERQDMREVILAGAQGIRRVGAHRGRWIAAAVALLLVGGVAGGILVTALRGPAVVAGPTPTATGPTLTPDPTRSLSPTECTDVLERWLVYPDAVVGGQKRVEEAPEELGRHLPPEPAPTCIFASVDGSFVQEAWYVVSTDEEARAIEAQVRRAFEEDVELQRDGTAQEGVVSYLEDPYRQPYATLSVRIESAAFADLVGLGPGDRVVRVARWQAEY